MSTNPKHLAGYAHFCRAVPKVYECAQSTLELVDHSSRNFYIIGVVNERIDVALLHSVLECQCDK